MIKVLQVPFEGTTFKVRYCLSFSKDSSKLSSDFYFFPILDESNLKFAPEEFRIDHNKSWPVKWKSNTPHSQRYVDFHSAVMKELQEIISNQNT